MFVVALFCLALLAASNAPAATDGRHSAVLIEFAERPTAADIAAIRRAGGAVAHRYRIVPAVAARVPERAVDRLERNPRVSAIEPDRRVRALDYRPTHDWGIAHIGADLVHADGNTGSDSAGQPAGIAVIDSGIDCDHPELAGTRCRLGPSYVGSSSDDDWGHGTHVAGSAAARRDAGIPSGVVGVAPSAELTAYKVLNDQGYGSTSDVIAALDHVWNGGSPRADVINMSLGWRTASSTFRAAADRAYGSGVVLVAAAGNGGNCGGGGNSVSYPARYDSVIAVAAVDRSNERPCWSSTGDQVELAAPGVSVFSTWPEDLSSSYRDPQPVCEAEVCHYKYGSGTSMSAPHVAGAAALVLASGTVTDSNGANGAADELRRQLRETARDIGRSGRDEHYGHGLVDVAAAVAASGGGEEPPPSGDIKLEVSGYKVKGRHHADLAWSGAESATVTVYRNGSLRASTENDGAYTDHTDERGSASYTYKVCDADASACSGEVTVSF